MRSILLLLIATTASAQYNLDRCQPPANAAMAATLTTKEERGTPLVITGVVRDEKGAPVPHVFVRAFHADAGGVYTALDDQRPRICGVARTDAAGRYRFVTIKPGSYPNTREPAHVHFEMWAKGADVQRALLQFEGDPFLARAAGDGRTAVIRPLTRDAEGTLRCERDFTVER
jgi:protocatechuate 3,4-dioxygenase beta subunit